MSAPVLLCLAAAAGVVVLVVVCAVCPLPDRDPRPDPDLQRWLAHLPSIRPAEQAVPTSLVRPPSPVRPARVIAADRAWCPAFLLDTHPPRPALPHLPRPRREVIDVDVA